MLPVHATLTGLWCGLSERHWPPPEKVAKDSGCAQDLDLLPSFEGCTDAVSVMQCLVQYNNNNNLQVFQPKVDTYLVRPNLVLSANIH